MSFTQELAMVPRFGLEVSPALVTFAEMMMLPFPAMQVVIDEELCSNEALERLDPGECPICGGGWRSRCPACAVRAGGLTGGVGPRAAEQPDHAGAISDTEELLRAVRMETTASHAALVEYVVDSLDCHGMLDRGCAEMAAELKIDESVVSQLLDVIRRVGPPGVGATSATECLLLQLDALGIDDELASLARAVISAHLPALAKGQFAAIATSLGVTADTIKQVLELIRRRLRPYPAFDGNATPITCYVVPDVVVREHAEIPGEFCVDLVEPAFTRLGVRPIAGGRGGGTAQCAPSASVSRAKAFVARLHDRWETLRRVTDFIVARQHDYLVRGDAALRPLTRAEVAAAVGLHESTVSRAVADKYALLPDRTIVPLSRFFGVSGGVDGELRRLVATTDGHVSDQRLTDLLRDAGYPIARRTVAKHRARLGIDPARMR